MATTILEHRSVEVKKVMFGLITRYIYTPTNSPLRMVYKACDPFTGERLKQACDEGVVGLRRILAEKANFHFVDIGNMQLGICYSDDKCFVALQVEQYHDFVYRPVSSVVVATEKEATDLLSMLL